MSSDQEFSDSSANSGSPQSFGHSANSSPLQLVPELTVDLSNLTCIENPFHEIKKGKPALIIKEQPNGYFRFRYKSEMSGTHGCITGSTTSKTKTYPSVELVNYPGNAVITCRLTQWDNGDDHPHQLLVDDRDEDISAEVGPKKGYEVKFAGMGIIHPGKKMISGVLYEKLRECFPALNDRELKNRAQERSKKIELNIVRLKFSAYDIVSKKEICQPVYSEPIRNMKSAQTNDLKICRMSLCSGSPDGGDEIFLLVEKVSKKNIEVRFVEVEESTGEVLWSADGSFAQNDVHHQYAIVVKTPPYDNPHITSDVKVQVELRRTNDGMTSAPMPFTYNANPVYKLNKKRKANSYSSIGSSDGSLKSNSDIPYTVMQVNTNDAFDPLHNIIMPQINVQLPPSPLSPLGEALMDMCAPVGTPASIHSFRGVAPLLGQGSAPPLPEYHLSSAELSNVPGEPMRSDEFRMFLTERNIEDYYEACGLKMTDIVSDSATVKREPIEEMSEPPAKIKVETEPAPAEYNAFYTQADGREVKEILKKLSEARKNKDEDLKNTRAMLERLFSLHLSNGDTFLHMALCTGGVGGAQALCRAAAAAAAPRLLDTQNHRLQTALHLAVLLGLPQVVALLVESGCNPMVADIRGDNAIHYAVNDDTCLEALLKAIDENDVKVDLDAFNNDKKTALHIAAYRDRATSVARLLKRGARATPRDAAGRAPLHYAVYGVATGAARELLQVLTPSEVDLRDEQGFTALQVACGGAARPGVRGLLGLLLQHQADPMSHADTNKPAWVLALDKPEMMEVLKPYITLSGDEMKEKQEDYESADEEEQPCALRGLPLYRAELCALLDASGAWRSLAGRARCGALAGCYAAARSPTAALLADLQEMPELSSSSLALMLRELGEAQAADVITRHLAR